MAGNTVLDENRPNVPGEIDVGRRDLGGKRHDEQEGESGDGSAHGTREKQARESPPDPNRSQSGKNVPTPLRPTAAGRVDVHGFPCLGGSCNLWL